MKEKDFQKTVIDIATRLGYKVYFTKDSRESPAGFPDLVLVSKHVIFAELKINSGVLSPAQVEWMQALSAAEGVFACVWRPKDIDTIIKVLTNLR